MVAEAEIGAVENEAEDDGFTEDKEEEEKEEEEEDAADVAEAENKVEYNDADKAFVSKKSLSSSGAILARTLFTLGLA